MIDRLLEFSIRNRVLIIVMACLLMVLEFRTTQSLPVDAVPDITNVQVQVSSYVTGLPALDVERQVSIPIESAMTGIPGMQETRSSSKYALSQVTVVFADGTDIIRARQLVSERLSQVRQLLPVGTDPVLDPISTGLGQIFMWSIEATDNAKDEKGNPYSLSDLRTIQEYIVRPRLTAVQGVAEINFIGGFTKQYQVQPLPLQLIAHGIAIPEIVDALQKSNVLSGGGFIEHQGEQFTIGAEALLKSAEDIANVVITSHEGVPVFVKDVAEVKIGTAPRAGLATHNGKETVLGIAMMLSGENSRVVAENLASELSSLAPALPDGVSVKALYNRANLVNSTIKTVARNLVEGAILVIVILFVLLGNFRAACIVSLTIPLAMLFATTGMVTAGISANLLSLGAIDFGIIVDGAVVMCENILRHLSDKSASLGRNLSPRERAQEILVSAKEVAIPTLSGVAIIMIVYLPILTLSGIEGKMFVPMAKVVLLALLGALLITFTFTPAALASFISNTGPEGEGRLVRMVKRHYLRLLDWVLLHTRATIFSALLLLLISVFLATRLGSEFIPKLDEKDFVVEYGRLPSIGLEEVAKIQVRTDNKILSFPEVEDVFSKAGSDDLAADADPPSLGDSFVILKPREQWPDPSKSKEQLMEEVEAKLKEMPGTTIELSQPVELRMNDLIAGVKGDVAIKVFGDDVSVLQAQAAQISKIVRNVKGASGVVAEDVSGLPFINVSLKQQTLSQLGIRPADVLDVMEIALAGKVTGQLLEGDKKFDIVVNFPTSLKENVEAIRRIPIPLKSDSSSTSFPQSKSAVSLNSIPLGEVADIVVSSAQNEVSRDNGKRRIVVQADVVGRDLGSFVQEAMQKVTSSIKLPSGYWISWGGQFGHLQEAKSRLILVVPLALCLILILLYSTFGSIVESLLVFTGIPFALTGGVFALYLRGIPFSISAGIGFIALSGVAVLNGVVLVSFIRTQLALVSSKRAAIKGGAEVRLRAVLTTALVASLGFVPMALSTKAGAEVQRPLATVVIGGIVSSTLLTLLVLPALYALFGGRGAVKSATEEFSKSENAV